jgi:hypothetical protein
VKRALPWLAAVCLAATAAGAYIPSAASLVRKAAARVSEGSRSKEVELTGWLWLGDGPARQATLRLQFPLQCRLQQGDVSVAVDARAASSRVEDGGLGEAAAELVQLACPLVAYRGQTPPEAVQSLRAALALAGLPAQLAPTSLARLYDRVAVVLGAGARQLDRPQLWLDKDLGAPTRLLAKVGDRLDDLRLLQYGSPAAAAWFPRAFELWRGAAQVARFEVLSTRGFAAAGGDEEDD